MSAASAAGPDGEARDILRRYFLAMGVPFGIDLLTSIVYAVINARPLILLPWLLASSTFLLVGVGLGALALSRPLRRYLAGRVDFPAIERDVANLPRRSATVVACLYAPMLAVRLLSPRAGITFGAEIEISAWIDTVCSFLVVTSFNYVLTFFVVSAYLDTLAAGEIPHEYGVELKFLWRFALRLQAGRGKADAEGDQRAEYNFYVENGRVRIVEGLAMPREEEEFNLSFYNSLTTWVSVDALVGHFGLTRGDLADVAKVADAVGRCAARLPTYITLKDVKKRWGHGQEDVYPVCQFEKLWGDMTAVPGFGCGFVAVPRARGQQLKDPAQLDGWLRDGSAAHVEALGRFAD